MTPQGRAAHARITARGRRHSARGRSLHGLTRLPLLVALLALILAGCSTPVAAFTVGEINLALDRAQVLAGDTVVVSTEVRNTGTAAGTYQAALAIDGTTHGNQDVVLDIGQAKAVHFEIEAGAPGDHTITIGSSSAVLTVTAAAVFEVAGLDLAPGQQEIRTGDDVEFVAQVRNTGTAAGTYPAELSVDGIVEVRQDVAVAVGATETVDLVVRAGLPGDHEVTLGDRHATLSVPAPAAFAIDPPMIPTNPADKGGQLDVLSVVTNSGGLTGTYPVSLTIDGKVVDTQEATIPGGESATVRFSVAMPAPGRHTVATNETTTELVVWDIQRPKNGKVLSDKVTGGRGELTITNGGDRDAVVVLAKASTPTRTLLAVYVRGDSATTVKGIKDGTYAVFFRSGERWDAYSKAFTSEQVSRRFEDTMEFSTKRTSTRITWSVWTITLQAVVGGNAATDIIGDEEFPAER